VVKRVVDYARRGRSRRTPQPHFSRISLAAQITAPLGSRRLQLERCWAATLDSRVEKGHHRPDMRGTAAFSRRRDWPIGPSTHLREADLFSAGAHPHDDRRSRDTSADRSSTTFIADPTRGPITAPNTPR
jgi:hypothetical protein